MARRISTATRRFRAALALTATLLLAGIGATPQMAYAIGNESLKRGSDLEITVDSRWCGNASGGYYPVRFKVLNKGPERVLTFAFSGRGESIPTVSRSLAIAQNATVRFTLSIPSVSSGTYGEIQVLHEGRPIQALSTNINLPDVQTQGQARPSLLVIAPTTINCDMYEAAIDVLIGASSPYGAYGSISSDHETIRPEMLPQSWIDYSGVDVVAIAYDVLSGLSGDERTAILDWVHTGGTLLVYNAGRTQVDTDQLDALLQFERHAASATEWHPADTGLRREIGSTTVIYDGDGSPVSSHIYRWPDDAFFSRNLMLGNVYAFGGNPFPGSANDWAWFINTAGLSQLAWPGRHGMSARTANEEFLNFLIPSVKGVPVGAFLILITLFTVVIGPLNYIYLWKRRRLYLLVFTIPLIALATSLALFGYSAVAHGFSTRSRMRSLTLLDQQAGTTVTLNRLSLYSGLAPSGGLTFSPQTAVYPVWPPRGGFETGQVDWTESQSLHAGWLRSRMRTQFFTVNHADQRGRIETRQEGDKLQLTNGLEWGIGAIIVADESGVLYYGTEIPAGGVATLARATADNRRDLSERLKQNAPGPPDFLNEYGSGSIDGGFFYWGAYYGDEMEVTFHEGLLEQNLASVANIRSPDHRLANSSYVAVLAENPDVETGLASTRDEKSLHVLVGHY